MASGPQLGPGEASTEPTHPSLSLIALDDIELKEPVDYAKDNFISAITSIVLERN